MPVSPEKQNETWWKQFPRTHDIWANSQWAQKFLTGPPGEQSAWNQFTAEEREDKFKMMVGLTFDAQETARQDVELHVLNLQERVARLEKGRGIGIVDICVFLAGSAIILDFLF